MSVRVVRTRNGEDVIADLFEVTTKDDQENVIGFQLRNPYNVWITQPFDAVQDNGEIQKITKPELRFEPYAPLLKGNALMLKLEFIVSAYETHEEVIAKYNELVEATSGKNTTTEERKSDCLPHRQSNRVG